MPTQLEKNIMTRIRAIAFVRHFFFPHARKTYALLLSVLISTHYISYAAIVTNISEFGILGKLQYLWGALFLTRSVTLFVLACISFFAVSLAIDILKDFRHSTRNRMQHA